jgi:large subunit ribosomal protein L10e
MALRKACAYSKRLARPYTRKSAVMTKSFIKTIPPQKVVKLRMGDIKAFDANKFPIVLKMITVEDIQMRDTAIESARQFVHHELEANFLGQYYLGLKVFPHHILRENRMLTGAGADRMQTGMAHSFGTAIGRAAFLKAGGEIFIVGVNTEKAAKAARQYLKQIKAKLPCSTRILVEKKVVQTI